MLVNQAHSALKPTLAVLDWGIGGMDFYRIFKQNYPQVSLCYFSDSGSVPYGKQQKEQLILRLSQVACFLKHRGVSHLVVACNAMSTVLPETLPHIKDVAVTGVIEPALSAVLKQKADTVGVVGGRRTILSGAYGRPLRQNNCTVMQRIAQPLSALIERGEKDTPLFRDTLKKIMLPLKKTDILILACTHYPAVQEAFQVLVPKARLINPSAETFQWVSAYWLLEENGAPDIFFTTGDPDEMRRAAFIAFGVSIGEITRISPEDGGTPC